MGHEDRDWYKEDRERRDRLIWSKKRRWPYQLRPGLPWWIAEPLRIAFFMLPFVLAYYAWKLLQ